MGVYYIIIIYGIICDSTRSEISINVRYGCFIYAIDIWRHAIDHFIQKNSWPTDDARSSILTDYIVTDETVRYHYFYSDWAACYVIYRRVDPTCHWHHELFAIRCDFIFALIIIFLILKYCRLTKIRRTRYRLSWLIFLWIICFLSIQTILSAKKSKNTSRWQTMRYTSDLVCYVYK